jgi:hypothetical protein
VPELTLSSFTINFILIESIGVSPSELLVGKNSTEVSGGAGTSKLVEIPLLRTTGVVNLTGVEISAEKAGKGF